MIYLVRHGQDSSIDNSCLTDPSLTDLGKKQASEVGYELVGRGIKKVYTSDISRCLETALIISDILDVNCESVSAFSEYDRGLVLGMDKKVAKEKFGVAYWSDLEWEQPWPDGESPAQFYSRVSKSWYDFKKSNSGRDIVLVTHGGVINLILCLENNVFYTNKLSVYDIPFAQLIVVEN